MDKLCAIVSIDPWTIVNAEDDGGGRLFGFVRKHPVLGGRSWALSSPVVSMDDTTAVTATGTYYRLGRQIRLSQLQDAEAHVALRCLREQQTGGAAPARPHHHRR